MKIYLALMVAIIGVGMVAADENLKERLRVALKSLQEGMSSETKSEDLEMQARDTKSRCKTDTNNCDGHGSCVQSTFGSSTGQYICRCDDGYRNNINGGCSALSTREIEYLSKLQRDMELDMLARNTVDSCMSDTMNCDGNGMCVICTYGTNQGKFICLCRPGYKNNVYGGCSPQTKREMEFVAMRSREVLLEMLARDTLSQCNADTFNCDGAGECKQSNIGQFICQCDTGYSNNLYGGCSLDAIPVEEGERKEEEEEEEDEEDEVSERRKEIMQQIADLLNEE